MSGDDIIVDNGGTPFTQFSIDTSNGILMNFGYVICIQTEGPSPGLFLITLDNINDSRCAAPVTCTRPVADEFTCQAIFEGTTYRGVDLVPTESEIMLVKLVASPVVGVRTINLVCTPPEPVSSTTSASSTASISTTVSSSSSSDVITSTSSSLSSTISSLITSDSTSTSESSSSITTTTSSSIIAAPTVCSAQLEIQLSGTANDGQLVGQTSPTSFVFANVADVPPRNTFSINLLTGQTLIQGRILCLKEGPITASGPFGGLTTVDSIPNIGCIAPITCSAPVQGLPIACSASSQGVTYTGFNSFTDSGSTFVRMRVPGDNSPVRLVASNVQCGVPPSTTSSTISTTVTTMTTALPPHQRRQQRRYLHKPPYIQPI